MSPLLRWTALAVAIRFCIACGAPPDASPVRHPMAPATMPGSDQEAGRDQPVSGPEADDSSSEVLDGDPLPDDWADFFAQITDAATAAGGFRASGGGGKWCLSAAKPADSGSPIRLRACDSSGEQAFHLDGTALKVLNERCVRPGHGNNKDGSTLRLYACDPAKTSQSWRLDGQLLRWSSSGKCLDVTDGEFRDGTTLQLWECNPDNENQHFALAGKASAPAASKPAATPRGTKLDLSKWHQETYAKGTFNQEEQRYTGNGQNVQFRADGSTVITARKDNGEWASARLSGDPVGSLPAYYEAFISLPNGKGTWPAFWLTARGSWPQGGEIDIMEQVNGDGQTHWSNHWGSQSGKATFNTHESVGGLDLSKPHTYGGYITANGVQFYLDGKPVGKWVTYPAQSNFPKIASEMVPIVNLAMGGMWPGHIPNSTGTQTMVVHWVTKSSGPPRL